nr:Rrf2 family transcriptional regulator [Sporohalobacter salinus]
MQLTQETDYAIRAVLFLAKKEGEIVEAQVISDDQTIPKRFLLKICRKLIKAGIIESYRGKHGGYKLAKKPEKITLKDVIETIEKDLVVNRCQLDTDACNRDATDHCVIHHIFNSISDVLAKEFSKYDFKTLAEMD